MTTNYQVFTLQHKLNDDKIIFEVFADTGLNLEGGLNREKDYVHITPNQRKDLPLGPQGQWEECDVCESDRYSARAIYALLKADGYLLVD